MRLFSGLFWGVFLVASGAILLLKYSLNLSFSGGKLIFGLLVLLIGVSMLTSGVAWKGDASHRTTMFSDNETVAAQSNETYSVVFAETRYDLSQAQPGSRVKINCAFGSAKVQLPAGAVIVTSNCAFGNVSMPDGSNYPFGSGRYTTGQGDAVYVEVSCAFGEVSIYNP